MLFILLFANLEYRREFLLMFASGLWALVPDLGWWFLRVDMPVAAATWKTVFNSAFGYLFWLHPFIDANEFDSRVLEMTSGFVILGLAVTTYYFANDWEARQTVDVDHSPTLDNPSDYRK